MEKSIIVATVKATEKWFNVTDNEGLEYGVSKEKAPQVSAQLATATAGTVITGKVSNKDGKNYIWDIDNKSKGSGSGGGKTFTKNYNFEAATASLNAAATLFSLDKDKDAAKVVATARIFNEYLKEFITK